MKTANANVARVASALRYEQGLLALGEAFKRRGLSPVVVKGQAIVDLAYPPSQVRLASDVDLLVGDDEQEVAETLLAEGYVESENAGRARSQVLLGERVFTNADRSLPPVELHRFLDKLIMRKVDYACILERARPSARAGLSYPAIEDLLLLAILHAASDASVQHQRTLDDLQHLLENGRPDVQIVLERARQWGLLVAVQTWMSRLKSERGVAGISVPPGIRATVGPALSDWLRPVVPAMGLGYFVHQLGWHDSPATVAFGFVRYAALRIWDRAT